MTRARLAGVISMVIVLASAASVTLLLSLALRVVNSPPQIYRGPSIPEEYAHLFQEAGIPPTATDVRLYYDPSLRGGFWACARLSEEELATYLANRIQGDGDDTLSLEDSKWFPDDVKAWWPVVPEKSMLVNYDGWGYMIIVDPAARMVYAMVHED